MCRYLCLEGEDEYKALLLIYLTLFAIHWSMKAAISRLFFSIITMVMIEKNNLEIAAFIDQWIAKSVK